MLCTINEWSAAYLLAECQSFVAWERTHVMTKHYKINTEFDKKFKWNMTQRTGKSKNKKKKEWKKNIVLIIGWYEFANDEIKIQIQVNIIHERTVIVIYVKSRDHTSQNQELIQVAKT